MDNKELKLEAEKHWKLQYIMALDESTKPYIIQDFIAGANSKYVEKQKLKFAVEQLDYLYTLITYNDLAEDEKIEACIEYIKDLKQKLSEL